MKIKVLCKVFSLTFLSTLIKIATNFLIVKVIAVIAGPSGIALFGNLSNISAAAQVIGSGGINGGVTKYVSEYKSCDLLYVKKILGTSTKFALFLSFLIGVLLIVFSKDISISIFADVEYRSVVICLGVMLVFLTLNNQLLAILNGFKEFNKFILVQICSSILSLVFTLVLIYFWNLKGALIASVSYQSVVFIITLLFAIKSEWFTWDYFLSKIDFEVSKKLIAYSLMTLTSAISVPAAQIFVRNTYINLMDIKAAGIWESMNKISSTYLMLITTSLAVYYLPRLSEEKDARKLRTEIINMYWLVIPLLLTSSIFIYSFRDLIVNVLFTSDFSEMKTLFKYQLIGDFFKIVGWILSYLMIAKALIKYYVVSEIIFSLFFAVESYFLISRIGLPGATIAYMVNYFLYFLTMMFLFRKTLFSKI